MALLPTWNARRAANHAARVRAFAPFLGAGFIATVVVLVLVIFGSAAASAGGPVVTPPSNRRFDHEAHGLGVGKAGKPAVKCESCHKQDTTGEPQLVGKREHARCLEGCHTFTADCSTMAAGVGKVCASCHPTLKPACLPKLPPSPGLSFEAKFTHGRHTAAGSSAEPLCARCHEAQAFAVGAPPITTTAHRACSGCHERGAKPFMTECAGCHRSPQAQLAAPPNPYALHSFDHRDHMRASKAQGCMTCHQGLANANENALPRPQMNSCQTQCHNGKTAFAATGTRCTTCHNVASDMPAAPVAPVASVGFSHAVHKNRNVDIAACATCHQVESNGNVLPSGMNKDHKPCANSGCHEREFFSRTTKICTTCHVATNALVVPWQKPAMTTLRPAQSELPGPMNHAVHVAAAGANAGNTACLSCHGDKFTNAPAPHGHAACTKCHAKPAAANTPAMSNCQACHQLGVPAATRAVSAWSVAANFAHTSHNRDPQRAGAAPNCSECHASVVRATSLANVSAPTMQSCDRCHNGREAFKTTGFDCARCHQKAPAAAAANLVPAAASLTPAGPGFGRRGQRS